MNFHQNAPDLERTANAAIKTPLISKLMAVQDTLSNGVDVIPNSVASESGLRGLIGTIAVRYFGETMNDFWRFECPRILHSVTGGH
jgi:hypothetical protein